MPVLIDGERVPKHLSKKIGSRSRHGAQGKKPQAEHIRIALINNMPDAALEDTEAQFFDLLESAAGALPVSLKLYSLPNLPRSGAGQRRLQDFYFDTQDLLNSRFDGIIMTGTEPCQSNLRDEPFWPILTEVLEWAERSTSSAVLSCLAAHASVLHSDGIPRHRLADKQFGVFQYQTSPGHQLIDGTAEAIQIPHSRWNEVRTDALTESGYEVLTQSAGAGVDLFVKKKRDSLFLHFQGHPEYGLRTLLKEYRRDIKRYLRHERETYPTMPHGYFDSQAVKVLSDFQGAAMASRSEGIMSKFPEAAVAGTVQRTWHTPANVVYRNWLGYLAARKTETPVRSSKPPVVRAINSRRKGRSTTKLRHAG